MNRFRTTSGAARPVVAALLALGLACAGSRALAGGGPVVLLDSYHNNEWKEGPAGRVRYHYTWNDTANSGFSLLAGIITGRGGKVGSLTDRPTPEGLAPADILIIVDPDTPRETPDLHLIDSTDSAAIVDWVRAGGTLVVLGNDRGNMEFDHLNRLTERFGIRFNENSRNDVVGTDFARGTFSGMPAHPLFTDARKIYLKEISTLALTGPARPLLTDRSDVIIATSRFGHGFVVAAGDPWFYNEYMDGRKLPEGYDNAVVAGNLIRWLADAAERRRASRNEIVVSADGAGDFATIQGALDSAQTAAGAPLVISVRNGTYREKIFIRRSNVTLIGEDRDSTRIDFPVLREEWTAAHNGSDWGSGTVNIDTGTTDVTLANLTVRNWYGRDHGVWNKHQFAVRGFGTKVMLLRCAIRSDGGDALSLWDRTDGMYYHNGCVFEGWVDYVCPRGWCYITRSSFFGHNTQSASLWHDGSGGLTQKFVITKSTIDGVPGFPLGRNHLDGQTFLVRCSFSSRMADRPFYRPPSSPAPWKWGDRHYFSECHREGGDYPWFADNLAGAEGAPRAGEITARWTFDGQWDPEAAMPSVLPGAFLPSPADGVSVEPPVVLRWVAGRNALEHRIFLGVDSLPLVGVEHGTEYAPSGLSPGRTYRWRVDEVTDDGVVTGEEWTFTTKGDTR
jgi:pectinesterase